MHVDEGEASSFPSPSEFRPLTAEQAALFELSPNPVLVLDVHFRIRFVNTIAAQIGRVDATELIGLNVWERFPEFEGTVFQKAYTAVLEEQVARRFEEYSSESDQWRSVYAYPADGGVVAVLEDISAQRRAERALRESDQALARAQAVAAIGSWTWTLPGTLQWSAETFRILGVPPASTAPHLDLIRARIVDDDERIEWSQALDDARHGRDFEITVKVNRPDTTIGYYHVQARAARTEAGDVSHIFGTIQDLTERLRADENLRRSEKTLRLAQEAANIGSFDHDLRTRQTRWSDQLIRIFGYDPESFDQHAINSEPRLDVLHPDDREKVRAVYGRASATGEKQAVRHRIVRPDGEVRHVFSSAMLVRDAKGDPARLVGTALDVTEQVQADAERMKLESQIQQAQKLESLGILAGGIAHDFNNLLVGILGNASLALLDIDVATGARRSIEEIERAAQRAAELTRQLLAYAGKGRFLIEPVDASAVVAEMASLLRTAVSRTASVQLDLPAALPSIEVDATQFRQVVMNLITNASDALGESAGAITVRTGAQSLGAEYLASCVPGTNAVPGHYVYVEVRDTGSGMDAITQQRIFDPFFSTKFTGRGLGLAATLGIVRGHMGAIRVYSEVGSGTSFKLHFPASTKSAPAAPPPREDNWRSKGRVLVVDDEVSVRAVTRALLQRRGFEVDEAEDGLVGLEMFGSDPYAYSLVMLDLTMPGLGGEETFRAMRGVREDIRVLLMSGYNEQEVTQRFIGRGLAGFLQKPFRADDLYAMIARALDIEANDRP